MLRPSIHRIAQLFLFVFWLGILTTEITQPAGSQSCGNRPQFYNATIPPPKTYWTPDTGVVVVKIDDSFQSLHPDAIERIIDGNEKWNNPLTCSLVHFTDFETVLFTDEQYADPAPMHHVYWQVDDPNSPFGAGVAIEAAFGGFVFSARVKIKPNMIVPDPRFFNYLGTHEIGHTFGLDDCLSTKNPPCISEGLTIMGGHTNTVFDTQGPTACDFAKVRELYCPASTPTPSPTPSPTPPETEQDCQSWGWSWNSFTSSCEPGGSVGPCPDTCTPQLFSEPTEESYSCLGPATDYCLYPLSGCEPGRTNSGGNCCCSYASTPVLIDVAGNGFLLTDAKGGVDFDINGDGKTERLAWTIAGSDDAWLVLDHSNNGRVDDGRELFGNYTPQLRPLAGMPANGFLALAEYDKTANGGNIDGAITQTDAVFFRLRLWQDTNHNGVAESFELQTLGALGINTLELDYKESGVLMSTETSLNTEQKLRMLRASRMGRWAWDVIW